jgi:hypothetical protein
MEPGHSRQHMPAKATRTGPGLAHVTLISIGRRLMVRVSMAHKWLSLPMQIKLRQSMRCRIRRLLRLLAKALPRQEHPIQRRQAPQAHRIMSTLTVADSLLVV